MKVGNYESDAENCSKYNYSTVHRNLPIGRKCESAPAQSNSGREEGVPDFISMMEERSHACSVPEESLHAVKVKAAATAWTQV